MPLFNHQQIQEIQEIIKKTNLDSLSRPISVKIGPHKHDGIDNIKIPSSSVTPSTAIMGKIKFTRNTTYTLFFSASNPTTVSFNGFVAPINADTAIVFQNGIPSGYGFGYLTSNWGNSTGTYLVTFSSGEVRAATLTSGSEFVSWSPVLSKSAGATAIVSSSSSSALVVGSATLFGTYYFQPDTTSTTKMGGKQFPINGTLAQCSSNLYIDSTNIANTFPHVDQFYLVNVFSPSGHVATAQLINFTGTSVDLVVTNLLSGWQIIGNFIIT